jgi:hypothetical protein
MLGPRSACRASIAVSTIRPCSFSTNKTSHHGRWDNQCESHPFHPFGMRRSLAKLARPKKGIAMPEKYNPAPVDEHAMDLKEALRSDKKAHDKVEKGLQ